MIVEIQISPKGVNGAPGRSWQVYIAKISNQSLPGPFPSIYC
jgi:hypothetical protein